MKKLIFLGVSNIIVSILLSLILIFSTYNFESFPSKFFILITYSPHISIFVCICINICLAYKLLIKRDLKLPLHIVVLLTFYSFIWIIITFLALDIAYKSIFHLFLIIITLLTYFIIKKTSTKLAIAMGIFSLFLSVTTTFNSFTASYCWHQGELADPTGQELIIATKEDAQLLKTFNVKEGDNIGVSFKYNMLCYSTFDIEQGIIEQYSLFK